MFYIIFDLEFNQDYESKNKIFEPTIHCPFEVIQIGAVKMDQSFHTVDTFNRFIKPTIYLRVNQVITDLTGISTGQLMTENAFPMVFRDFIEFIGDKESIFCVWGKSDMKEIFRNVDFHQIESQRLPRMFIDIQPYVSTYLNLSQKKLLNLRYAVETLNIMMPFQFHNALNDAYYTAEILKKVYQPTITPKFYEPNTVTARPRHRKQVVDFEKLILQFEKMYYRELTKDEQDMVILAYKMGKTGQFIKK